MTIVTLVLGLLLSAIDPSTGNPTGTQESNSQQAQQSQSSDYIICNDDIM